MTTATVPTVSEAEASLREATEHLKDLESRLTSGDMSVRQSDLTNAHNRTEFLAKALEGAKVHAHREGVADRAERGAQLHREFVEASSKAAAEADESLIAAAQAIGAAVDKLTAMRELKHGFQGRWNEIFHGATEEDAALVFKYNHSPGNSFGAVSQHRLLPTPNPVQVLGAVFAEALSGHTYGYSGVDRQLAQMLRSKSLETQLTAVREFASWAREQTLPAG